ncbi:ubiquilin [Nematocida sp. LUAm3]|nr:ubiquilin [Nematocida sp. LUAm3]KAI5173982.1 ubiquilin [Nematocida sp. LUAm2]KAI5177273.1 ubiquilin [Nematocida sp. LUAm1]
MQKKKVSIRYMQEKIEVEVPESITIEELKKKIEEKSSLVPEQQKLIYKGNILTESPKKAEEIKLQEGDVIFLSKVERSANEPREIKGQVNPKKSPPGMDMMKDPAMKKILGNSDVMKGIMEMFPDMKKENPELKKLMESSQMLEEMTKLAEDPEYMNVQMKNVDIAMAKLETIPGGFNMLRSMLKTQKDPNTGLSEGMDTTNFKEGKAHNKEEASKPAPNPWGTYHFNPILEYREQVEYMKECGFNNIEMNIQMLLKHQGDADAAIMEILYSNQPHSPRDSPNCANGNK